MIDISEVTGAKGDGVDNSNETPGCHGECRFFLCANNKRMLTAMTCSV